MKMSQQMLYENCLILDKILDILKFSFRQMFLMFSSPTICFFYKSGSVVKILDTYLLSSKYLTTFTDILYFCQSYRECNLDNDLNLLQCGELFIY